MQELILIRGLPGSGKSTLAAKMAYWFSSGPAFNSWFHVEADMYHINPINGVYEWKAVNASRAHKWCQDATEIYLKSGGSVIVSNTFTRKWEMQPYFDLAQTFGAKVTVIECQGNYGNIHNVPEETIQKMRERFER